MKWHRIYRFRTDSMICNNTIYFNRAYFFLPTIGEVKNSQIVQIQNFGHLPHFHKTDFSRLFLGRTLFYDPFYWKKSNFTAKTTKTILRKIRISFSPFPMASFVPTHPPVAFPTARMIPANQTTSPLLANMMSASKV